MNAAVKMLCNKCPAETRESPVCERYHVEDLCETALAGFCVSSLLQDKDISYSALDPHKPKRFATLSFGLKKKKRKYEDNLSKSTFGLHVPESEDSSLSTVSNCPPVSTHLDLF